jgi:hypothetical protein
MTVRGIDEIAKRIGVTINTYVIQETLCIGSLAGFPSLHSLSFLVIQIESNLNPDQLLRDTSLDDWDRAQRTADNSIHR